MSAQHTPGPWIFEAHGAYKSDLLGEDWPVGYISTKFPPVPIFVLGEILERNTDEIVANATLMAAAPELLEVATRMLPANVCITNPNIRDDLVVPMEVTMGELRKIAAAVAKATKEPS